MTDIRTLPFNLCFITQTLHALELEVTKRNITAMDFEKVRLDRDRIVEEVEKRQVEADNRLAELTRSQLALHSELLTIDSKIATLDGFIAEEDKDLQKLNMNHKILLDKDQEHGNLGRKLRKREK